MHLLYKKSSTIEDAVVARNDFLMQCRLEVFTPKPFHLRIPGECVDANTVLSRFYFWLITRGGFRIFYLRWGDDVVHTSYVVPKCGKFPFMKHGDYEIGPCMTAEEYRGQGCYPYMLNHITSRDTYSGADFYMIVRDTNRASVAGIEKAGFHSCGTVKRSAVLKRYKKEK